MPKRKKAIETNSEESNIIASSEVNVNELFVKLKEFENKALIDKLKILERKLDLLQKAYVLDRTMLKEIKQHVSYLSLAHEELLNTLYSEAPYRNEDTQVSNTTEKSEKKWN